MQPSGGPSLPPSPSPLPPPPYQQSYSPESGLTFSPAPGGAALAAAATPTATRKGANKVGAVIAIVIFVTVILVVSGALDGLFSPSGSSSNGPDVQVTNTSASHTCPVGGTPYETFLFTLVNGGSTNANVNLGFYLNSAQVKSGTYYSGAGTSTPYSVTAYLSSCPASGSTYYLDVLSIAAA